jgi:hypothetical protein
MDNSAYRRALAQAAAIPSRRIEEVLRQSREVDEFVRQNRKVIEIALSAAPGMASAMDAAQSYAVRQIATSDLHSTYAELLSRLPSVTPIVDLSRLVSFDHKMAPVMAGPNVTSATQVLLNDVPSSVSRAMAPVIQEALDDASKHLLRDFVALTPEARAALRHGLRPSVVQHTDENTASTELLDAIVDQAVVYVADAPTGPSGVSDSGSNVSNTKKFGRRLVTIAVGLDLVLNLVNHGVTIHGWIFGDASDEAPDIRIVQIFPPPAVQPSALDGKVDANAKDADMQDQSQVEPPAGGLHEDDRPPGQVGPEGRQPPEAVP